MTVLVFTAAADPTAGRVCDALAERGTRFARWDIGDFPQRLSLTASVGPGAGWNGRLTDGEQEIRLADVHAVYYRRPSDFRPPDHLSGEHRRLAVREARHGFGGLLSCLPVRWVSHPARIADAEFKPVQLRVADEVGFRVPRTLITNEAEEVCAFARTVGKLVYKPFASTFLHEDDGLRMIYANVVELEQLLAEEIALTANLFQEWVPKKYDVRVTAVDGNCFSAVIHARSAAARIDWRSDYPALSYEEIGTPEPVTLAISAYLRRFGLSFGAFDFVVTPADEWYFLECNPNGQWGWIEHETGMPIAAAVADLLSGKETR